MAFGTTIKRLIRPLVPDRLVARRRLRQQSQSSRVNVEVFLTRRGEAKAWLDSTPDTYRVRFERPEPFSGSNLREVRDASVGVAEETRQLALEALGDPEIEAVSVADTTTPRLVNRRRAEPDIGPRLIVTTSQVLDEIGGVPPGDHPLPGLWARLRDAGFRLGLVPTPQAAAPIDRADPIDRASVVILSAVPMHDIGGGSRSAQLAVEFVRQGFHVTYVSLYEAQETTDLGIRFISPSLEQYRATGFDAGKLASRASKPALVLVEAPAPLLGRRGIELQGLGWRLVYDMIDDWSDPALGGDWFDSGLERSLVGNAEIVVASAPDLVGRSRRMGSDARLVPNAVNTEVFAVDLPPRPADLPEAEVTIGYHGSLYGDWFDWDALEAVATKYPEAAVVVIGDDKVRRPAMPANVHFLGLKAQTALPAYLQRLDVGVIPFKINDTTHAVSPLKAYEFLASGVPIAAPPLRALEGLAGTHFHGQLPEAVDAALGGQKPSREKAIAAHSWATRVKEILSGINEEPGDSRGSISQTTRPVEHYSPEARLGG